MIVPRDYAGQRQLWEQLSVVFGGPGPDPPGPDPPGPDPPGPDPPEPEPCVQDWKQLKWTNVLLFRDSFHDLIMPGNFWGATGMDRDTYYMYIDRQIKCVQIVRTIAYNKSDSTIEVPGYDGWWFYTVADVPIFKGVVPGECVSRPGQPARYWMSLVVSDAYLTVDYALVSMADPPAFPEVVGSHSCPLSELTEVYLCLWNWGYSQYRPDMDREFRVMMFTEGDYLVGSQRPKVVNL